MKNRSLNEKLIENLPENRWEIINHTILPSNLKLGDKILLGTLIGKFVFTVVSITDCNATLESGDMQTIVVKNESGDWQYNHWTKDKNAKTVLPIIYKKEI